MKFYDYVEGTLLHVVHDGSEWLCASPLDLKYTPLEPCLALWRSVHGRTTLVFDDQLAIDDFLATPHTGECSRRIAASIPVIRGFGCASVVMTVAQLHDFASTQVEPFEFQAAELSFDRLVNAEVRRLEWDRFWGFGMFNPMIPGCWYSPFSSAAGLFQYCRQLQVEEALVDASRGIRSDLLVHYSGPAFLSNDVVVLPFSESDSPLPALNRAGKAAARLDAAEDVRPLYVDFKKTGQEISPIFCTPVDIELQIAPALGVPHCLCKRGMGPLGRQELGVPLDVLTSLEEGLDGC